MPTAPSGGATAQVSVQPAAPSAAASIAGIASTYFNSFDHRQMEAIISACVVSDYDEDRPRPTTNALPKPPPPVPQLATDDGTEIDEAIPKGEWLTTLCGAAPGLLRRDAQVVRDGLETQFKVDLINAQTAMYNARRAAAPVLAKKPAGVAHKTPRKTGAAPRRAHKAVR